MNTEIISEKKKAGRPRATPPKYDAVMRDLLGPEKTRRTVLNWIYGTQAHSRLQADPDFDYGHILAPKSGEPRITILAELERIEDGEPMYLVARRICEQKLSTAKAIALIRRVRFKNDEAPEDRLVVLVLKAIDTHLARYPTTTLEDVLAALDDAALAVKTSIS
jgi:hypothetical protein